MIEKYFRAGIRFKWTKPQDGATVTDGAIVDSTRAAVPLVYDGLDGNLIDPYLMQVNVSTLGLTMRTPIHHTWLDYAPGRTARVPIGPYDVLTGFMSGCIIAYWTAGGVRYAGHVGTLDGRPLENRTVKKTFAFGMAKDTKGFSPAGAWQPGEIVQLATRLRSAPNARILGLVTTHGNFYSVLMFSLGGDNWCVGGAKPVAPIMTDQLKMLMMRYD